MCLFPHSLQYIFLLMLMTDYLSQLSLIVPSSSPDSLGIPLILHRSPQCPSLKGTEKDVSPVSRYKAAPLHCHLQIQASHCESRRKTKERKKKGKRNWVIDKRASSGVGLRNVFITAQKGFEECFGVEKCVNCRVLDSSLSRFFPFSTRYNRICK